MKSILTLDADAVIVIKNSEIVETGKHKGLLKRNDALKDLFNSLSKCPNDDRYWIRLYTPHLSPVLA